MTQPRLSHLPTCDTIMKAGHNGAPCPCSCREERRAIAAMRKKRALAAGGVHTAAVSDGAQSLGDGNFWRRPLNSSR